MALLLRVLRMALAWALGVGVVGVLGMLLMRFHARDYLELVPSGNFFDYLMLTSFLIPLCAVAAAATPRRFLDG
jgi:hypothetical protein